MIIAAKLTEYNKLLSKIEVTWTPSTWWERNVLKLKPHKEVMAAISNNFWREDGSMLTYFSKDSKFLYDIVHKAYIVGLRQHLETVLTLTEQLKKSESLQS